MARLLETKASRSGQGSSLTSPAAAKRILTVEAHSPCPAEAFPTGGAVREMLCIYCRAEPLGFQIEAPESDRWAWLAVAALPPGSRETGDSLGQLVFPLVQQRPVHRAGTEVGHVRVRFEPGDGCVD